MERAGSPWITKFRSLADDTANAGWELLLLFLTTCKTHNKKCQKLCQRNFATLCCNTLLRINTPSVPRSDHNQSAMENSNQSAWKVLTLKVLTWDTTPGSIPFGRQLSHYWKYLSKGRTLFVTQQQIKCPTMHKMVLNLVACVLFFLCKIDKLQSRAYLECNVDGGGGVGNHNTQHIMALKWSRP